MFNAPHLLLASKSPRRQQLLKDAGFSYDFIDIEVDEDFDSALKKEEICMYLSQKKANAFEGKLENNVLVAADTIVWVDNQVLNKPQNAEEAFQMLSQLSGNTHVVFTGVTLKSEKGMHTFYDQTEVTFYLLSPKEIEFYIQEHAPFDKAGAYGVQDWMGYIGVKEIKGCFYNVMGFPIAKFYRELQLSQNQQ